MKRVVVHIDRLVLNGFPHRDRHAIAAGLERELGRVFAQRDTIVHLRELGSVSSLRVRGVPIAQGSTPEHVGASVARGIGREIKR